MKQLLTVANGKGVRASFLRLVLTLFMTCALASSFWVASLPIAQAAQMTPAEMIQTRLPAETTIASASDGQLLEAVYKSVKQFPKDAGLIVRTASGGHKPLRPDLLCTAVRAQRERHALNCTWVANILREWIKAEPRDANQLTEAVALCAEECRGTLEMNQSGEEGEGNFVSPPSNVNPPPGSFGGGSASGNTCIVCRNGHEMPIACSEVNAFVSRHPGTSAGPCQVTPTTNL
ncbi:MAG: hypothetical protein QOG67_1272 [Verrucomicrobiota bacterium]|jgi:hypothetical protein